LKSSNATASAFGWQFQSNAAIMLMLKNIERASKVKVEGQTEDIEITFSDGQMLMAQAKAVYDPYNDFSHAKEKLDAGLRTLSNAANIPAVEQLIFVTNSPNPFNDAIALSKFSSPLNMAHFSELPASCQKIIRDICASKGYDFDLGLLTICVMQFHGENEDERYKVLTALTMEFLNRLGAHRIPTADLLTLWQHSFTVNSSQLTTSITKKGMVWPVIAILCEVRENDESLEDYDESEVDEILRRYKSVINNNSERFEFVSRVLSDFIEFHPGMKYRERSRKFIDECWKNFMDTIDLKGADPNTEEMVIRLALANVLKSNKLITEIKGKVKL